MTELIQEIQIIENLSQEFKPIEHGLESSWRLTKFSDLKG